jgi:hypothetical protein
MKLQYNIKAGLHVLHDKVRLTDKSDAKYAAPLLMLFLSLSKNTMDEALMITIISLCALKTKLQLVRLCEVLKPHSVHAKRQICRPHVTYCLIRLA